MSNILNLHLVLTELPFMKLFKSSVCHNLSGIILFSFLCLGTQLKAQGIGGGVIYNLPTNNIGFDIRYEYPKRQFVFAPQAAIFPGIGPITEFNVGGAVHYLLPVRMGKVLPYALLFGGYNGWISHESAPDPDAKFSNWSLEPGVGITLKQCLRPYAEYRYSVKWDEANVRIGIIYTFNCGGHICQTYI